MHPDNDIQTAQRSGINITSQRDMQVFLNALRSGPGFIGWKSPNGKFKQQHFATTPEALDIIEAHEAEANIWASMAPFPAGVARSADNAATLKSVWLDVDAHGTGPHETPKAARKAIKAFVTQNSLPLPQYLVFTGHGFQGFWTFEEAISKADWLPVAEALQDLAQRCQLGADPITADAARILRVPGTYNFRDPENPVLAELYEVQPGFTDPASLHEAIKSAQAKLPPPPPKPQKAKTPVLDMADTLENEAIVEAMLAKLDPDCLYPDWRDILWSVAATGLKHAEDLAQSWSANGTSWDLDAFDTVWSSYEPNREKGVGFGTLVHKARVAGYIGPLPNPPEMFARGKSKTPTQETMPTVTIASKGLLTQRASDIEPQKVEWLIEGAIPMGTMIVIGGQPGMGKSQIAIKLAAAITTGEGLPDA
jgi:hypothetical protein